MNVTPERARWVAMRRLTDEIEPRLAAAVLADLRAVRTSVHPELLTRALSTGHPAVVRAFVTRAAAAPLRLQRALGVADEAFFAGGHLAAKGLHPSLLFHDAAPYAIRAALKHGAVMVQRVSDETRRSIAQVVATALRNGRSPREQAREIQDLLGLSRRQVRGIEHFTSAAVQAGRLPADVDRRRRSRQPRRVSRLVVGYGIDLSIDPRLTLGAFLRAAVDRRQRRRGVTITSMAASKYTNGAVLYLSHVREWRPLNSRQKQQTGEQDGLG